MAQRSLTECDPLNQRITLPADGLWGDIIQRATRTREMQRLHRIKQVGFADFVYRSASHARLIHSLGVYHMAKRLTAVIRREHPGADEAACQLTELAALVHDIGHGPFSHVFERSLATLGLATSHTDIGAAMLADPGTEIGALLAERDASLPGRVAALIRDKGPDLYSSVVASAFDADRLDYVRRDALMAGTEIAAMDLEWLLSQLTVAAMPATSRRAGEDGFVLSIKGLHALESYLLARFHLYERVYLHPDVRGFELLFTALVGRLARHCRDGGATALPGGLGNPLVRFVAEGRTDPAAMQAFDDTACFWGLVQLCDSQDGYLAELARRLRDRQPLAVVDLSGGRRLDSVAGTDDLLARLTAVAERHLGRDAAARWFLLDSATAAPFGHAAAEQTIYVMDDYGRIADARSHSSVLQHLRPRPILRAYVRDPDLVAPLQAEAEAYWRGDLL